jgi:hypothetical protein
VISYDAWVAQCSTQLKTARSRVAPTPHDELAGLTNTQEGSANRTRVPLCRLHSGYLSGVSSAARVSSLISVSTLGR